MRRATKRIQAETFGRIMEAAVREAMLLGYWELERRCRIMAQRYGNDSRKTDTVDDAIWLGYAVIWTERFNENLYASNT